MNNELLKVEEVVIGTAVVLSILFGLYYNVNKTAESTVHEAAFKIAIIDTGYQGGGGLKVCDKGHFNFNTGRKNVGVSPLNATHGTKVATIIAQLLKNVDYCAIIYQVESIRGIDPINIGSAAMLARAENVVAVNISLTGPNPDQTESMALWALSQKAKLFIAAGNQGRNLTKNCSIFPACYNITKAQVIGALDPGSVLRAEYSNYGKGIISNWQNGELQWKGTLDYGTSYATPRALSKYVLSLSSLPSAVSQ